MKEAVSFVSACPLSVLKLVLLFVQIKYTINRLVSVLMSAACAGTHTTSKPEHTMKYRTNKLAWSKKSWEMPSRSSFTCSARSLITSWARVHMCPCSLEGTCSFSLKKWHRSRSIMGRRPTARQQSIITVGGKLRRPTGQLQFSPL